MEDIPHFNDTTFCSEMASLLTTEFIYLHRLFTFQNFLYPMLDSPDVPDPLIGKHEIIFGNIEEIYEFHNT